MSRKLEVQNGSSSKKAKPSPKPSSPEVVIIEKPTLGIDQDLLRCPICREFPRKEVYQCNTGHSVCANCQTKLRRCPTCQGMYKGQVRNYLAEGLLDSMKFHCSWKEKGCKVHEARRDLTSHEAQCEFNPNSVKFCFMFDKFCKYKFCPVSTQDPAEMNVFLTHMKSVHRDFSVRDVNRGESFVLNFKYDWSIDVIWAGLVDRHTEPTLYRTILRLKSTQTNQEQSRRQLFGVICRFVLINGQTSFLIKCVRFTDENRGGMSISLALTGREEEGAAVLPQVPELNWTVQPQGIRELKDFLMGTQKDDLSSYHMIPVAFLKNYITEQGIPIEFIFD